MKAATGTGARGRVHDDLISTQLDPDAPVSGAEIAVLPLSDVATAPTQRDIAAYVNVHDLKGQSTLDSLLRIAALVVGWIGLFFVARWIDHPVAWVVIWIAQAFILEGFGGAIHECVHSKLFPTRRAHKIAGWLLSAPRLYHFPSYQASHLAHHRYTHDHTRDSEPVFDRMGLIDYLLYMNFSHVVYTIIIFYQSVFAAIGVGPAWLSTPRQRRLAAVGAVVCMAELAVIVWLFFLAPVVMVQLWLIPWILCNGVITSINTQPEHYGAEPNPPGSALTTTRTIYSNRFLSFFVWNNNLHTAHHLVPSLPGRSLPALQELIDPYCRFTCRSYTRWHLGLLWRLLTQPRVTSAGSLRYWLRYGNRTTPRPSLREPVAHSAETPNAVG